MTTSTTDTGDNETRLSVTSNRGSTETGSSTDISPAATTRHHYHKGGDYTQSDERVWVTSIGTGGPGPGPGSGSAGQVVLRIDQTDTLETNGSFFVETITDPNTSTHDATSTTVDTRSSVEHLDTQNDTGYLHSSGSSSSLRTTTATSHEAVTYNSTARDVGSYDEDRTRTVIGVVFVLGNTHTITDGTSTFSDRTDDIFTSTASATFTAGSSRSSTSHNEVIDGGTSTSNSNNSAASTSNGWSVDTSGGTYGSITSNGEHYVDDSTRNDIDTLLSIVHSQTTTDSGYFLRDETTISGTTSNSSDTTNRQEHYGESLTSRNEDETSLYVYSYTSDASSSDTVTVAPQGPSTYNYDYHENGNYNGTAAQLNVGTALTADSRTSHTTDGTYFDHEFGGDGSTLTEVHNSTSSQTSDESSDDWSSDITYSHWTSHNNYSASSSATLQDSPTSHYDNQRLNGSYTGDSMHHGVGIVFAVDDASQTDGHDYLRTSWGTTNSSTTADSTWTHDSTYSSQTDTDESDFWETVTQDYLDSSSHTSHAWSFDNGFTSTSDDGAASSDGRTITIGRVMTVSIAHSSDDGTRGDYSSGGGSSGGSDAGSSSATSYFYDVLSNEDYTVTLDARGSDSASSFNSTFGDPGYDYFSDSTIDYNDTTTDITVDDVVVDQGSSWSDGDSEYHNFDQRWSTYHEAGASSSTSNATVHDQRSSTYNKTENANSWSHSHGTSLPFSSSTHTDAGKIFAVSSSESFPDGTFLDEGHTYSDWLFTETGSYHTESATGEGINVSTGGFDERDTSRHVYDYQSDGGYFGSSNDQRITHQTSASGTIVVNELIAAARFTFTTSNFHQDSDDQYTRRYEDLPGSGNSYVAGWGSGSGTFHFVENSDYHVIAHKDSHTVDDDTFDRINDLVIDYDDSLTTGDSFEDVVDYSDYVYHDQGTFLKTSPNLIASGDYVLDENGFRNDHTTDTVTFYSVDHQNIQFGDLLQVDDENTFTSGTRVSDELSHVWVSYEEKNANYSRAVLEYPYWTDAWEGKDTWVDAVAPGGPDWDCGVASIFAGCTGGVPFELHGVNMYVVPVGVPFHLEPPTLPASDGTVSVAGNWHLLKTSTHDTHDFDFDHYTVDRTDTRVGELAITNEHTTNDGSLSKDDHTHTTLDHDDWGTINHTVTSGAVSSVTIGQYDLHEEAANDSHTLNEADGYSVTRDKAKIDSLLDAELTHSETPGQLTQTKDSTYDFVYFETSTNTYSDATDTRTATQTIDESGGYGLHYSDSSGYHQATDVVQLNSLAVKNAHNWIVQARRTLDESRDYNGHYRLSGFGTRVTATDTLTHTFLEDDTETYRLAQRTASTYSLDHRLVCMDGADEDAPDGQPDDAPCGSDAFLKLDFTDTTTRGISTVSETRDQHHFRMDATSLVQVSPSSSFTQNTLNVHDGTYFVSYTNRSGFLVRDIEADGLLDLDHTHTVTAGGYSLIERRNSVDISTGSDTAWALTGGWSTASGHGTGFVHTLAAQYSNGGRQGADSWVTDAFGPHVLCEISTLASGDYDLDVRENVGGQAAGWTFIVLVAPAYPVSVNQTISSYTKQYTRGTHARDTGNYTVQTTPTQKVADVYDQFQIDSTEEFHNTWQETWTLIACGVNLGGSDTSQYDETDRYHLDSTFDEHRVTDDAGTGRSGNLTVHESIDVQTSGSSFADGYDWVGAMNACYIQADYHWETDTDSGTSGWSYNWGGTFNQPPGGDLVITATWNNNTSYWWTHTSCLDGNCGTSSDSGGTSDGGPTNQWPVAEIGYSWGNYDWWSWYGWYNQRGGHPGIGLWSFDLAKALAEEILDVAIGQTLATGGASNFLSPVGGDGPADGHDTPGSTLIFRDFPSWLDDTFPLPPFADSQPGWQGPGRVGIANPTDGDGGATGNGLSNYRWWLTARNPCWCDLPADPAPADPDNSALVGVVGHSFNIPTVLGDQLALAVDAAIGELVGEGATEEHTGTKGVEQSLDIVSDQTLEAPMRVSFLAQVDNRTIHDDIRRGLNQRKGLENDLDVHGEKRWRDDPSQRRLDQGVVVGVATGVLIEVGVPIVIREGLLSLIPWEKGAEVVLVGGKLAIRYGKNTFPIADDVAKAIGRRIGAASDKAVDIFRALKSQVDNWSGMIPGKGNLERQAGTLGRNIVGGVPEGFAAHHLINVANAEKFEVMRAAEKLGYNIDRGRNGLALPSTTKAIKANPGLPAHTGGHLGNYYDEVAKRLRKLNEEYIESLARGETWDAKRLSEAIGQVEDSLKRDLLAGKIKLQN